MFSSTAHHNKNRIFSLWLIVVLLVGGYFVVKKYVLVRFDIDFNLLSTSSRVITQEQLANKKLDISLFSSNVFKEFKDYSIVLTDPSRVPTGKNNPFEPD
ncbi:MAG: hypothetical protein KAJ48_10440 [Elusimicrobiales bacterium]|nr:hypothetical protein [Elusimicrobiales bacterium]